MDERKDKKGEGKENGGKRRKGKKFYYIVDVRLGESDTERVEKRKDK